MRYREGWLADAALLRAAALAAPQAPVPTCPGWVGRDVVDHVGEVYAHKAAVLRLGRRPAEGEWPWAPDDDTVFAWFDDRLAELLHELDAREAADPAWTFLAADHSVGFWWRRMAHETAIHRVDAEQAAGWDAAVDAAFAADGIDEKLETYLPVIARQQPLERSVTVVLRADDVGSGWTVTVGDEVTIVRRE